MDSHSQQMSVFSKEINGAIIHFHDGVVISKIDLMSDSLTAPIAPMYRTAASSQLAASRQSESQQSLDPDDSDTTCVICLGDTEHPIVTRCKHWYCQDCFEDLCLSRSTEQSSHPLSCAGVDGSCQEIFGVLEIQSHVPNAIFDRVLSKALAAYVQSHRQELRYCQGPDCTHLYRPTSEPHQNFCMGCGLSTCTSCHGLHPSMTCEQYRESQSADASALAAYKREHGIRDCQRCGTGLEKTGGCNHMECRGCGAHICWECLAIFNDSESCYNHMVDEHGNIGDGGIIPEDGELLNFPNMFIGPAMFMPVEGPGQPAWPPDGPGWAPNAPDNGEESDHGEEDEEATSDEEDEEAVNAEEEEQTQDVEDDHEEEENDDEEVQEKDEQADGEEDGEEADDEEDDDFRVLDMNLVVRVFQQYAAAQMNRVNGKGDEISSNGGDTQAHIDK